MRSDGQQVVFAAPRKAWRRIVVVLFGVCSVLLIALLATSPDLDSGLGLALGIVLIPLWPISLFGTLFACLGWFVQFRHGGTGSVAWMDSEGVRVKGPPAASRSRPAVDADGQDAGGAARAARAFLLILPTGVRGKVPLSSRRSGNL